MEFTVLPYKETKDTFMLGGIDEIMVTLEDSMVTMATILSSRYVAGIRTEVRPLHAPTRLCYQLAPGGVSHPPSPLWEKVWRAQRQARG